VSTDTLPVLQAALGINNVDDPKAASFQVGPRGGKPKFLTQAQNVDLDKEGFVRRRVGRTKRLDLTSAHSLWASASGRLFLVDSGTLYEIAGDFTQREVDTGLGDQQVSFTEAAGQIFYSNETKSGVVDSFWGIPMPSSPFIIPTTGNLQVGRYMVAVTAVRAGVESGARQPAVIELDSPAGLAITLAGVDGDVDSLNIYLTQPNGELLYFLREIPPSTSFTVNSLPPTTDPLKTFGFYPPLPAQHIALYRGRMLLAVGNALYWSQPLAYHHFRIQTDVQLFPDRITMLGALDRGLYVAAGSRTFHIAGDEPDAWQPRLVDTRQVAEGEPLRLPTQKLPSLQSQGEVLVWATADGFVAGLPDGSLQHLTDGRLAVDSYKQSSLVFREEEGIRQILLALQTKQADTRFGATDRVTCKVTRANEAVGEP